MEVKVTFLSDDEKEEEENFSNIYERRKQREEGLLTPSQWGRGEGAPVPRKGVKKKEEKGDLDVLGGKSKKGENGPVFPRRGREEGGKAGLHKF